MVDLKRMRYLIRRYPMACLRAEQARIRAQKLTRTISEETVAALYRKLEGAEA